MTKLGWQGALVAAVALTPAPAPARGNCAAPGDYEITQTGATVRICHERLLDPQHRTCPGDGLLRLNAAGEAALITACDADRCFVDECVPAGTFEYGLKTPFACGYTCSPSVYYGTAVVPGAGAGCQRTLTPPTVYTGAVPWTFGADPSIDCPGRARDTGGCGSAGAAGVLSLNAAIFAVGALLWRARARRRPDRP